MGHYISGFVADLDRLTVAARLLPGARICRLHLGLAFLPLTDEIVSPDDLTTEHGSLVRLTQVTLAWAEEQSKRFAIAYVETDYFGGRGNQSAVVWRDGAIQFGPMRTGDGTSLLDGAINRALRELGVVRGRATDEFAAIGLNLYRDNEDWAQGIGEPVA
jgi:hypothetical protein